MNQKSNRKISDSRMLEYRQNIQTKVKADTIYTESRMTMDALKSNNIRTFLVEEIGRKLTEIRETN